MWKPEHRRAADRRGLRYPSDLTDDEWALVAPQIPPARRGGRPRDVNLREVLNAIFYVLSTGCQWQALPKDLPPKSTVHHYFMPWEWDDTLERLHHALYLAARDREGRKAAESSADAARRVAETYDPLFLAAIGAKGMPGDPKQALSWYRRASTLGDPDATKRLTSLLLEYPE